MCIRLSCDEETIYQLMVSAYNMALPQWVPIGERLPEKDGRYLACVKASSALYSEGWHSLIFDSHNGFGRATHKHVSHWIPEFPNPKD